MTLEEQLLELGFKKVSNPFEYYIFNISKSPESFKRISVYVGDDNQFVYIREGEQNEPMKFDDVVTIFNSDYDGELKIEWIEKLVNLLK